jgi:hypothetical protein
MPTIGSSSKPTHYWWAFGVSSTNQEAELLTMPEDGTINTLGQWIGGWNTTCRTKLCIWDSSGALLGQSAQFTVADKGDGADGNVDLYTADLTAGVHLSAGDTFFVGFSRNPADKHQVSGGNAGSGPHYDNTKASWPDVLSGATTVARRIGSYVADYTPESGGGGGGGSTGAYPTADSKSGTPASSTSWTVTYPSSISAGDLILVAATVSNDTTMSASGFTLLLDVGSGASIAHLKVLGKVAAGGESGTFTLTLGTARAGEWQAIHIPAASWYGGALSAGSTINASTGFNAATSSSGSGNADPPSLTPAWGDGDNIWLAMLAVFGSSGIAISGAPSGFGDLATVYAAAATHGNAIADELLDATSLDPATFTVSPAPGNSVAATIAIRPNAPANGIYIYRSGAWTLVS